MTINTPVKVVSVSSVDNQGEKSKISTKDNLHREDFSYLVQPSQLEGSVHISGAKNSVLRLLAASLLTGERIQIDNYPSTLRDAQIHVRMLEALGKKCQVIDNEIIIHEAHPLSSNLLWEGRSIRNTLLILGALVTRTGRGSVPLPGGCNLGERKIDLHEFVLKRLGADVWIENDQLCAETKVRLKGNDIHLPIRSTGATENAIICASLAEGVTRVWNPHIRPEILDLIRYLNGMGARIRVFGQEHIEIIGVEGLRGINHVVIPDNMEAITWLVSSVITNGDVEIFGFPFQDLEIPLIHLRESGARFYRGENSLIVRGGCCYPIEISTGPYPGINSDMQPLFAVYGAFAKGKSHIIDLRFPGRYAYVHELAKMGLEFSINGNLLKIEGGNSFHGTTVQALDLRAGAALVLAGLGAIGTTRIENAWQVERGYDDFVGKLKALGGNIKYA
jgi:UDP-N-acetylglucosamine 1-carboxyvinyltransferase